MPTSEQARHRAVLYCIVPPDLAGELHDPLREHFAADPRVEVIVEQRWRDRRRTADRRTQAAPMSEELRRVRAPAGRRADERRAPTIDVEPPQLPRRVRPYADRLVFVERIEPSTQQLEDADTARLVAWIQSGETEAFADLYLRYFDRVYAYLRVALSDPHAAEDVTQHVFANVLEALPRYERRGDVPFRGWLFRLVRNAALEELRKRQRCDPTDPEVLGRHEPEGENEGEVALSLDWVSDRDLVLFIERLPALQRQVLVLRYMLDLGYRDIARILNTNEQHVRTLHSRGVRFLRARLQAVGRTSRGASRNGARGCVKQLPVMAARRWALIG